MICGVVALVPALAWRRNCPADRANRWRCYLLSAGLLLVLAGIWLEHRVHDLRGPREQAVTAYLESQSENAVTEMKKARANFGMWHGISVLANYATILMVAGAMVLAASLPGSASVDDEEKEPRPESLACASGSRPPT